MSNSVIEAVGERILSVENRLVAMSQRMRKRSANFDENLGDHQDGDGEKEISQLRQLHAHNQSQEEQIKELQHALDSCEVHLQQILDQRNEFKHQLEASEAIVEKKNLEIERLKGKLEALEVAYDLAKTEQDAVQAQASSSSSKSPKPKGKAKSRTKSHFMAKAKAVKKKKEKDGQK